MRLKNLKINNFRNFESVDFPLSSNIVLLGELIETVWGLPTEDLEEIIRQLKQNIER